MASSFNSQINILQEEEDSGIDLAKSNGSFKGVASLLMKLDTNFGSKGGNASASVFDSAGSPPFLPKKSCLETMLELEPRVNKYNQLDPALVKLVTDNMFQGLGRHLRAFGFDTVIMINSDKHEDSLEFVVDGRVVITRGSAYTKIATKVPKGFAYNVKSDTVLEQLEEICNHFKVAYSPQSLFKFCQRCNQSEYILVPKNELPYYMTSAGVIVVGKKRKNNKGKERDEFIPSKVPIDLILKCKKVGKSWTLLESDHLDIKGDVVFTPKGVPVEFRKLQTFHHLIDRVYICNFCGKCYWQSERLEVSAKESIKYEPEY